MPKRMANPTMNKPAQLGQAANPQFSDPSQNINRAGFPAGGKPARGNVPKLGGRPRGGLPMGPTLGGRPRGGLPMGPTLGRPPMGGLQPGPQGPLGGRPLGPGLGPQLGGMAQQGPFGQLASQTPPQFSQFLTALQGMQAMPQQGQVPPGPPTRDMSQAQPGAQEQQRPGGFGTPQGPMGGGK